MEGAHSGERGQGLAEYGLLLFFIVLVGYIGVLAFGGSFGSYMSTVLNQVATAL